MPKKIKKLSDEVLIQDAIKSSSKSNKSYGNKIVELHLRGTDTIYRSALSLIQSENYDEKQVGIDILSQFGAKAGTSKKPHSEEVVSLFLEQLKTETDKTLINSLLVGLGHNNSFLRIKGIEAIEHFKTHKSKLVRDGLIFALLGLKQNIAIDTLIFLTDDKHKSIRDWATFGLGTEISKDSPKIRNALWKMVKDKDQDTKLEAIVGLAHRKDEEVKEVIMKELKGGEVGTLIFEAVLEFGDEAFLPLLYKNLKKAKKLDDINPLWIKDLQDCIDTLVASLSNSHNDE